jgi:hypothetical protein
MEIAWGSVAVIEDSSQKARELDSELVFETARQINALRG